MVVGAAAQQQQRRDPGALAGCRHPQRRQLFCRHPGCLGLEPGPRRVRQPQRERQPHRQPDNSAAPAGPITRRRSAITRRPTRSASAQRPWWAPAPYLGPDPAGQRAVQLERPGHLRLEPGRASRSSSQELVQNPTVTAPDGGNTSFFSPGQVIDTTNAPVPRRAGDSDQPLAEPAQLLRHLVGDAERGGRRRADEAAGPDAHPGRDPAPA